MEGPKAAAHHVEGPGPKGHPMEATVRLDGEEEALVSDTITQKADNFFTFNDKGADIWGPTFTSTLRKSRLVLFSVFICHVMSSCLLP